MLNVCLKACFALKNNILQKVFFSYLMELKESHNSGDEKLTLISLSGVLL